MRVVSKRARITGAGRCMAIFNGIGCLECNPDLRAENGGEEWLGSSPVIPVQGTRVVT